MGILFCLVLTGFIGRLFFIQLIHGEEYKELSLKQTVSPITGMDYRGTIYDRNGKPLTGLQDGLVLLLEKRKMEDQCSMLLQQLGAYPVQSENERYAVYATTKVDREICQTLCQSYGALAIKTSLRYSEEQPAIHLIDTLNPKENTVACFGKIDGQGYMIPGYCYSDEIEGTEQGITTTLDLTLQRVAEQELKEEEVKGAILVVDVKNGEILASASSPTYNPYLLAGSSEDPEGALINRATEGYYPPGCIFQLVVAAAALENHIQMENLNKETVNEMAMKFGLALDADKEEGLVTPMQVARMMGIIANNGLDVGLHHIKGVTGEKERRIITEETAEQIRQKMGETDQAKIILCTNQQGDNWVTGFLPIDSPTYSITVLIENGKAGQADALSLFRRMAASMSQVN